MLQVGCRRVRLLSLGLVLMLMVEVSSAATPATTRISDTVYRADGAPAAGTVLISWPSFTTGDNSPVAAGVKSIQLGSQGALSVDLVPNAGAIPAGTLYKVIYKLNDGTTATEFWSVGTSSPTTIGSIRTTPGSGTASSIVSREYVDTEVAGKLVTRSSGNLFDGDEPLRAGIAHLAKRDRDRFTPNEREDEKNHQDRRERHEKNRALDKPFSPTPAGGSPTSGRGDDRSGRCSGVRGHRRFFGIGK